MNDDKPERKLYLGKYLIAAYDGDDWAVGVWYNPKEMEEDLGLSGASATVNRIIRRKVQKYMIINGKKCKIYLIPWKERKEKCRSKDKAAKEDKTEL